MSKRAKRAASLARALAVVAAAAAAACGGATATLGPARVDIPVRPLPGAAAHSERSRDAAPHRLEQPPPSSAAKPSPFPTPRRVTLANGLSVATIEAHALPIVQLRVFVRAGMNYGSAPGVASITAQLLKDGGTRTMTSARLLERIETLGSSLSVDVGFDSTVLQMGVTSDHFEEAVAILAEVVQTPRFDERELGKLKAREIDDAEDKARSDGSWTATRLIFRELFPAKHPYASFEMTPAEITKVDAAAVRAFHRRFYVPANAELVLAGDVDQAAAARLVERHFGGWAGAGEAPRVDLAPPMAPTKRRVVLAHRPKSAQSDVFVVSLFPPRAAPEWPVVRVVSQVLGGGPASRLFTDVREQRSLAYTARASVLEVAHGEQPAVAYAGTQTKKTGLAVQGILENLERLARAPLTPAEVQIAGRFISDAFAIRMETIGSIADLLVTQRALGLPDGYWDRYRASVRAVTPPEASAAAAKLFHPDRALIVVSGDADVIASALSHFGDVTVVDPEDDFKTLRTVPANPGAPLEIASQPAP